MWNGSSTFLAAGELLSGRTEGPLVSGELERAAKWTRVLREKIEAPRLAIR